jgi:hypothetical protein
VGIVPYHRRSLDKTPELCRLHLKISLLMR